jgi:anti-repressor protein
MNDKKTANVKGMKFTYPPTKQKFRVLVDYEEPAWVLEDLCRILNVAEGKAKTQMKARHLHFWDMTVMSDLGLTQTAEEIADNKPIKITLVETAGLNHVITLANDGKHFKDYVHKTIMPQVGVRMKEVKNNDHEYYDPPVQNPDAARLVLGSTSRGEMGDIPFSDYTVQDGIIPIVVRDDFEGFVWGRELHEKLEAKTPYHIWIPRKLKGFRKDIDYVEVIKTKPVKNNPVIKTTTYTDIWMNVRMAKHLAMMEQTERSEAIRDYLIAVEDAWKNDDIIISRALQISNRRAIEAMDKVAELTAKIAEDKPKVDFANTVTASENSYTIDKAACNLSTELYWLSRNDLYRIMREWGMITHKNVPYAESMRNGWFERGIEISKNGKPNEVNKLTGKGLLYISRKLTQSFNEKTLFDANGKLVAKVGSDLMLPEGNT